MLAFGLALAVQIGAPAPAPNPAVLDEVPAAPAEHPSEAAVPDEPSTITPELQATLDAAELDYEQGRHEQAFTAWESVLVSLPSGPTSEAKRRELIRKLTAAATSAGAAHRRLMARLEPHLLARIDELEQSGRGAVVEAAEWRTVLADHHAELEAQAEAERERFDAAVQTRERKATDGRKLLIAGSVLLPVGLGLSAMSVTLGVTRTGAFYYLLPLTLPAVVTGVVLIPIGTALRKQSKREPTIAPMALERGGGLSFGGRF